MVALRIERSVIRLSAEFRHQPSTTNPVGHLGVEPRASCSQSRRAAICTSARMFPVRTAGFEPAFSWPPAKRDNQASPRSDRLRAPRAQVGWEVLEPSSAAFQATAKPSQLPARQPVVITPQRSAASAVLSPAQQKNPMPYDTGFALGISPRRDWRHKRNGCVGRLFAAQLLNR